MSTKSTWAHEIAKRASDVKWRVTKPRSLTGAYKIYMSPCDSDLCNHIAQVHLTSSDTNAHRVVEREMNAHGLAELEEKAETARTAERAARLAAGQREVERKAAEIAKVKTAVNRAAGPYQEPEYVDNSWFVGNHPAPWFRWVIVTPEQAKWVLDQTNTNNRPRSPDTEDHFAGVIKSEQWFRTHQGAAWDTNNLMQDGQTRFWAIYKGGIDVVVPCFVGMDPRNWTAIDEVRVRTARQLLAKQHVINGATVQGIVKTIKAFDAGKKDSNRMRITNTQVMDYYYEHKAEMDYAAQFGMRHTKTTLITPAALGAARCLLQRAHRGPDDPYIEAFFRGMVTERKLDTALALDLRDPRLKLLQYMANVRQSSKRIRMPGMEQTCLILRAWNHVAADRRVDSMRSASNMDVPRITVLTSKKPCPSLLDGEVVILEESA